MNYRIMVYKKDNGFPLSSVGLEPLSHFLSFLLYLCTQSLCVCVCMSI